MASFLYFMPDFPAVSIGSVSELPENHKLRRTLFDYGRGKLDSPECCQAQGPGGSTGLMFAVQSGSKDGKTPPVTYEPAKQKWLQVDNANGTVSHWLGWLPDDPPKPADLQRKSIVGGRVFEDSRGNEWIVPVVAPSVDKSTLPKSYRINAKGEMAATVRQEYADLFAESEKWFDWLWKPPEEDAPMSGLFLYAIKLFSVNYRVGVAEMSGDVLDVFYDDKDWWSVMSLSFDSESLIAERAAREARVKNPPTATPTSEQA